MFIKILQVSQEKPALGSLFNKVTGILASNFIKRDSKTGFFLQIFGICKNIYFQVETLENGIYLCFLISEVIHSLLGKVKKVS